MMHSFQATVQRKMKTQNENRDQHCLSMLASDLSIFKVPAFLPEGVPLSMLISELLTLKQPEYPPRVLDKENMVDPWNKSLIYNEGCHLLEHVTITFNTVYFKKGTRHKSLHAYEFTSLNHLNKSIEIHRLMLSEVGVLNRDCPWLWSFWSVKECCGGRYLW